MICIKCEEKPRKISKSGKALSMCNDCQQDYWRSKKPRAKVDKRIKVASNDRKCKTCKTVKHLEQFGRWGDGYRRTCLSCDTPPAPEQAKHILFVDGDQVVLAQVISEKATKNRSLIVGFYEGMGYSIQHVFEKKESQ